MAQVNYVYLVKLFPSDGSQPIYKYGHTKHRSINARFGGDLDRKISRVEVMGSHAFSSKEDAEHFEEVLHAVARQNNDIYDYVVSSDLLVSGNTELYRNDPSAVLWDIARYAGCFRKDAEEFANTIDGTLNDPTPCTDAVREFKADMDKWGFPIPELGFHRYNPEALENFAPYVAWEERKKICRNRI